MVSNYDIEGARNAGLSDQDIAIYLASKHNYDLNGALKAGLSYTDVAEYLAAKDRPQDSATSAVVIPGSQQESFVTPDHTPTILVLAAIGLIVVFVYVLTRRRLAATERPASKASTLENQQLTKTNPSESIGMAHSESAAGGSSFCIYCGAAILESARFCGSCGKELSWRDGAMPVGAAITNQSASDRRSSYAAKQPRVQSQKTVNWYMVALRKYAEFEGRARRKEYWYWVLFNILIFVILSILDMVAGTFNYEVKLGPMSGLYVLATIIPQISVTVRRLHDTDRSAWWWWLIWIPLINFVILAFMMFDGTPGPNRYGPDPKLSSP